MRKLSTILLLVILGSLDVSGREFVRPQYAPEYVPPIAIGEAKTVVTSHGADLSGVWTIRLDDEKKPVGEEQQWFQQRGFDARINLPDALQNAGYGSPVTVDTEWLGVSGYDLWFTKKYDEYRKDGNVKVPFFLQPERRFIGDAWYQKMIEITPNMPKNKDLILKLERPHWSSMVWLDGRLIGSNNSLGVPHVYNLGSNLSPGSRNLVVKVDNSYILPVGYRAHSVSDETQGAWNGMVGKLSLDWRNRVFLKDTKVSTDYRTKSACVVLTIENTENTPQVAELIVQGETTIITLGQKLNRFERTINFGSDAELWSEFHPVLHDLEISLKSRSGSESKNLKVGLRNVETDGRKILVNGYETFMRGTLDCCNFPLTGYPPMTKDEWLIHLQKMKDSGINHVRFHSWCPPEAAFEAGDELGMYLMPEIHIWGDPSNSAFGTWVEEEGKRIIDSYGNHPSFVFFTHGNEPWRTGKNEPFLAQLTEHLKAYDSRMLHTASANTIQSEHDDFTITTIPRGPSGWKGKGYVSPHKNPFIQHEPGQWCAYPNFDEMQKYTGPLKPKNFEIFLEQAEANGVLPQWQDFLHASGKLQALCYKEDCEAALASEGVAGTQLLGIADFSGQGTSLVGYLDVFYDEKGYLTKREFSKHWSWSVPLARMKSYVYRNTGVLVAPIIYSYFGEGELSDQTLDWEVLAPSGKIAAAGEFKNLTIKSGRNQIGEISLALNDLKAPEIYKLSLRLKGTDIENSWEFLVCEDAPDINPGEVMLAGNVDVELEAVLKAGKSVLLLPQEFSLAHPKLNFRPVFWNKFLFSHRKDYVTLGLRIDDKHPAFRAFPTKDHTTWGWENILDNSYSLVMDQLPAAGMIVQPIDDWNENRQLGLIFEYKVGNGKLLVCMADLLTLQAKDPAAKQLLSSLLGYMRSPEFAPAMDLRLKDLSDALRFSSNTSTMLNLGASVEAVNAEWKNSKAYAIDGDEGTQWTGAMNGGGFITVDLGKEKSLQGIQLANTNLKEFNVFLGNDLENLRQVNLKNDAIGEVDSLTLDEANMNSFQEVPFSREEKGRYLKIGIKSVYGRTIEFGELDVIFVIM